MYYITFEGPNHASSHDDADIEEYSILSDGSSSQDDTDIEEYSILSDHSSQYDADIDEPSTNTSHSSQDDLLESLNEMIATVDFTGTIDVAITMPATLHVGHTFSNVSPLIVANVLPPDENHDTDDPTKRKNNQICR